MRIPVKDMNIVLLNCIGILSDKTVVWQFFTGISLIVLIDFAINVKVLSKTIVSIKFDS